MIVAWRALDKRVQSLLTLRRYSSFATFRMETEKIEELVENWTLSFEEKDGFLGSSHFKKKKIKIRKNLRAYNRDLVFFHELVHAYCGTHLLDDLSDQTNKNNSFLVEWLARKHRACPELLRCGVSAFKLKPFVYDRISLIAFPEVYTLSEEQVHLPFCYEKIWNRGIFMQDVAQVPSYKR